MKKLFILWLLFLPNLANAQTTINNLGAAGALAGTEAVPIFQTANPAVRTTTSAIGNAAALTGDITKSAGSGVTTLATVNANVGSFGSATQCTAFTTNAKGLITAASAVTCTPAIASITGLGTGVATALAVNVGTAGSILVNGGALGTPSSGVATNLTGTAAGLTAGNVTTNANLTGMVTSVGNAASLGSFTSANLSTALTDETGSGVSVFGTAPTISSPTINTAATLAFITGSTQCLQVSTTGVVSGTGAVCGGSGSTGANPTATAGPTAVNGVATTFLRSDGAPAIQLGTNAQKGIIQVDGTTITATAGVISAVASGTVTSVTPGAGQVSSVTAACSQSAITTTGTLSTAECVNAQVGTSYAIVDGDRGKLITGTNAATQAYTIAQAGASTTFQSGWFTRVRNNGAGPLTITPTTSTICGASSLTVLIGQTYKITSDGTNYQCDGGTTGNMAVAVQTGVNYPFVSSDFGTAVYLSNGSNQVPTLPQAGTAGFPNGWYVTTCNINAGSQTITPTTSTIGGASTYVLRAGSNSAPVCIGIVSDGTNYRIVPDGPALGTNVAAALATTLSAAGGLTSTIASGTSALGTSAISSAACATVVTTAATNTATTDVVLASFNGDPTAVTGYIPATAGMLTIISYPTSGNVNFKVCNNTSASITPGAITLNWRVLR
jgi:hypothetical protein